MGLTEILIFVLILGAALAILQLAPINETVKQIGYILVVVYAIIWALQHLHLPI